MTPEWEILNDGCGNLAISIKPRKPIVYAIRDYPPNCGPAAKRLPFQALESKLQGSVNPGLLDSSKTEVCENTRIPDEVKKIATNNIPLPRKRVPAKRTFPPGCGRNAHLVAQNITNGGENMFQSCSISSTIEEEEEEEMQVNEDKKCLDGELSENITQKKDLTSSELPGRLIIVQGLMATPNCPWTNNRRGRLC